ncbi:MAG TPA: hypothetical protein VHH34_12475 [Pseudonocardiaceae bacterium]|nr:hypothetical protein [Pseudonocardiaceae bacterium]
MVSSPSWGRRAFLARVGLLGAAIGTAGVGGLLPRSALAAPSPGNGTAPLVEALRPVLAELARDTLNGLCAFTFPGSDAYSQAQGTPQTGPGGLAAGATDFLLDSLDNFVPFPDEIARPMTQALATGLGGSNVALPGLDLLPSEAAILDDALRALVESDATVPLSLAVAGLLNLLATRVNPAAASGAFLSPFARLSYPEKARVFELLERPDADLVALLDAQFPQPLQDSVSGLLRFVGGALLEFATFGGYNEYAVFDPATRKLTGRPVSWQLSGYQPDGPVEGWDDFIGFYQDRTEVRD